MPQTEVYPRCEAFKAHIDNRKYLEVAIQTESPKAAQSLFIDTQQSYVISPEGKKYLVETKNYTNSPDSYYKQVSVYIASIERIKGWSNGIWTLHFSFLPTHQFPDLDAKVKIWTFYYNPFIHGTPN